MINIHMKDYVWGWLSGDHSEVMTIADELSFEIEAAKFHPLVRQGIWDGIIRCVNRASGEFMLGLVPRIIAICKENQIEIGTVDPRVFPGAADETEIREHIRSLELPFEPYDFQYDAVKQLEEMRRLLVVSPTSSGKSLIIYMAATRRKKTLIVCPTKILVKQMCEDIVSYGGTLPHKIQAGSDKDSDNPIIVSTWQSIYKQPAKWFQQFDLIVGDEVHLFTAKSLQQLMNKTNHTEFRVGLSGSLQESKTHKFTLMGMFGPVIETITLTEMIERKISSDIEIRVIILEHQKPDLKRAHTYQEEDAWLTTNRRRNMFLAALCEELSGNSLLIFRKIEKHGDLLFDIFQKYVSGNVYYIHGKRKEDEIRTIMETSDDNTLLAGEKIFSTGVSINNIQNVILGNAIKSAITNLQTIGRGLRKDGKANLLIFVDIADDVPHVKGQGYSMQHLKKRLELYNSKGLKYKITRIKI